MQAQPKQQIIVWWVLWAAFQVGVFFYYHFLTAHAHQPGETNSSAWLLAFIPALISGILRWNVLPRFRTPETALPFFILGLAMAETSCFLGIFIFPAHRLHLVILSALCILQFIPVFAKRYFENAGQD